MEGETIRIRFPVLEKLNAPLVRDWTACLPRVRRVHGPQTVDALNPFFTVSTSPSYRFQFFLILVIHLMFLGVFIIISAGYTPVQTPDL
jgi:hypothetical protein